MLAGKQAAQICRRLVERPNALLPRIKSTGTISPIKGPDTHQGHGSLLISVIVFDL